MTHYRIGQKGRYFMVGCLNNQGGHRLIPFARLVERNERVSSNADEVTCPECCGYVATIVTLQLQGMRLEKAIERMPGARSWSVYEDRE